MRLEGSESSRYCADNSYPHALLPSHPLPDAVPGVAAAVGLGVGAVARRGRLGADLVGVVVGVAGGAADKEQADRDETKQANHCA